VSEHPSSKRRGGRELKKHCEASLLRADGLVARAVIFQNAFLTNNSLVEEREEVFNSPEPFRYT
jgi:hypothetical protein